jgi:hypothetical protein
MEVLKKFSVVHFPSDSSVEAVPSIWISADRNTCPFPINRPRGFQRLQECSNSVADPIWPVWAIEFLGTYG